MTIGYMPPINIDNIIGPIDDGEGNEVYGTNTTKENLINVLGKRKRNQTSNEE
jgi:hypothetical protein